MLKQSIQRSAVRAAPDEECTQVDISYPPETETFRAEVRAFLAASLPHLEHGHRVWRQRTGLDGVPAKSSVVGAELAFRCAPPGFRTQNLRLKSPLLCR